MSDELSETASDFRPEDDEHSEDGSTVSQQSGISPQVSDQNDSQPLDPSPTKKRKIVRKTTAAKRRRLQGKYSDSFRQLLNSTIHEVATPFADVVQNRFAQTHFGASLWTSKEKDVMFEALARYGRDDLPKVSAAIGSKSKLEVRDYLFTLKDGLVEHSLNDPEYGLASMGDMPAAVEIGETCEEKLNGAADALAFNQWNWEIQQEEKKYGSLWLIDSAVAKELDDAITNDFPDDDPSSDDENRDPESPSKRLKLHDPSFKQVLSEDHEIRRAAELFKTSSWIKLSTEVFMNAGGSRQDENWLSIATQDDEPSMMCTTFLDFHRLAVTITRRVVQTVLFQAMSRLRASDVWNSSMRNRRLNVTSQDVKAALRILGMKENARDFWIWTARRCGVVLTDMGRKDELSYEETEAFLSGSSVPPPVEQSDTEEMSSLPDLDEDEDDRRLAALEAEHERYAEELDQRAAVEEQARLLEALGEEDSGHAEDEEPVHRPALKRTARDGLIDWHDWTDYEAPWEVQSAPD
ncbi:hypothetical protein NA57DRAFT_53418 [Rhizodiscina lignyota]|uniref:Uncharacterized protein n=1 Tax=Rhizodiscina lignyota TaxID=1504668 RepID=A0A9P4IH27_9PEZI|nr:hypothetical protein NA57DRAFT_53418 [Rhizodiscina lignyota]